jgi:predicted permease
MSVTFKTIEGLIVIIGALGLGYGARRLGWVRVAAAPRISRTGMSYLSPVVLALVLWALVPVGWGVAALPVICVLLILLAWPLSLWIGRRLFHEPRDLAPWIICCMFCNGGTTYGAFLCYILLGVQGAALASVFFAPFTPLVYLLGFYIAGRHVNGAQSPGEALRMVFRFAYSRNPLIGVGVGVALLLAVPLFRLAAPVTALGHHAIDVLVPLDAAIQLFAIGLTLRLSRVPEYLRTVGVMHLFKFVLLPLLGLALAWLFGLWGKADNQLVQVVFIECCTPVAIYALVVAQNSGLNVDLANSLWVTTNLFAIAWAPVILLLARHL